MTFLVRTALAATVWSGASCGAIVNPGDASTDADASANTDVVAVADDGFTSLRTPTLSIVQGVAAVDGSPGAGVVASFYPPEPAGNPFRVTRQTFGSCVTTTSVGFAGPSAGAISVGGGTTGTITVSPLNMQPFGNYYAMDIMGVPWPGGTALTVSASGAVVPAFSTHLTMPPPIHVVEPVGTSLPVVISIANDLPVSWTGVQAPSVVGVDLQSFIAVPGQQTVAAYAHCLFDPTDSTARVPAAALSVLGPNTDVSLYISARNSVVVHAGSFDINVNADNRVIYNNVTLQ